MPLPPVHVFIAWLEETKGQELTKWRVWTHKDNPEIARMFLINDFPINEWNHEFSKGPLTYTPLYFETVHEAKTWMCLRRNRPCQMNIKLAHEFKIKIGVPPVPRATFSKALSVARKYQKGDRS